jgi:hypothetical protein
MGSFRDYKKYDDIATSNIDDYWTDNRTDNFHDKITPKGFFRAFGDWLKYGNVKKDVLR